MNSAMNKFYPALMASSLCGLIVASLIAYPLVTTSSEPNSTPTDLVTDHVVPKVVVPPPTTWLDATSRTLHQSHLDEAMNLISETCGFARFTSCADDETYEWNLLQPAPIKGSCAWLTSLSSHEAMRKERYCTDDYMDGIVKYRCPVSCGYCTCADDETYEWKRSCAWLTKDSNKEAIRKANFCTDAFMDGIVKYHCRASCGLCSLASHPPKKWLQLGNDIHGSVGDSSRFLHFKRYVALSSDGNTVAIGAPGIEEYGGHVRVFTYNKDNNTWDILGSAIEGEDAGELSGWSVDLSSDGNTVAIGSPKIYNGSFSGHIRVFTYNKDNNTWDILGSVIEGEQVGDFSGTSVALSSDGRTVAVGATRNDDNGYNSGHVRVFAYDKDNDTWDILGSDIDGEAYNDQSGHSVDLSSDGRTVAIMSSFSGHIRVFTYNKDNNTWDILGSAIDGEAPFFSHSLDLSSDGKTVAVGAIDYYETGLVRVFTYNKDNDTWDILGSAIDGEAFGGDLSGSSVALSSDGNTVAINALDGGHVRVFIFDEDNDTWNILGSAIDGIAINEFSTVTLSADGRTVGIGNRNDYVRVYTFS